VQEISTGILLQSTTFKNNLALHLSPYTSRLFNLFFPIFKRPVYFHIIFNYYHEKIFLLAAIAVSAIIASAQTKPLMGFSEGSSKQQTGAEQKFDSYLSTQNVDQYLKDMSARPAPCWFSRRQGRSRIYFKSF